MLKKKLGAEAIEKNWDFRGAIMVENYFKTPSTITIPEGCRKVGDWAFYYCSWLKKVRISESVKEIGIAAFAGCRNLEEVIIPKSVERIEMIAFDGCIGGKNTKIILRKPKSEFEYISPDAFNGCRDVEYAEEKTRN